LGVVRNLRALFPLSERQIVSYIQKCFWGDDEAGGDIECEEGEEYGTEDFDDIDESDDEWGETWVDAAVDYLIDEGVTSASTWPAWSRGTWYEAGDEQFDLHGEMEKRSYHLKGFTGEEEKEIFRQLKKAKRI
jgi:hypothetical protein